MTRQNLAWAIGYNASVLPLAMVGWLPAWGAAGNVLSSLLVVFNALRLRNLGTWVMDIILALIPISFILLITATSIFLWAMKLLSMTISKGNTHPARR